MRNFEKVLHALFYSLDKDHATFYILEEGAAPDTYKFLTTYYAGQNRTITPIQFKTKILQTTKAHLDKAEQRPVLLEELLQQTVELKVKVRHYCFMNNGKKIAGWLMNLIEVHPA